MVSLLRIVLVGLCTSLWATALCLAALFDRSGESGVYCARRWAQWILCGCGVRVECSGLEHIDTARSYVVMSNHKSQADIPALISTLPLSFRFVAKSELLRVPFIGWALRSGGHVVIDRSDRESAIASLRTAADRIRGGINVVIFPEGTRVDSDALGEFKSGGFHLALAAGVPVLPVSISGSRRIFPRGSLRASSGVIRIRYGAPIATEDLDEPGRDRLKQVVFEAIRAGLDPVPGEPTGTA